MTTDGEVSRLRASLRRAEDSASDAYRDTGRLIRLLSVIGTPSSPDDLIQSTLRVLSEVYSADVTCVADVVGDRLLVTSACGLPEDDPAFSDGWELGSAARRSLAEGRALTRAVADPGDVPPSLRGIDAQYVAWIPLTVDPDAGDELLILFRHKSEPFSATDTRVLVSVGYRMCSAVEAGGRAAAIERLAQAGHELAGHLHMKPLLNEAAGLLRTLTDADRAWIVTLTDGWAELGAYVGRADVAPQPFPRHVDALPAWETVRTGQTHRGQIVDVPGRLPQTVLTVPMMREGNAVALLCASGSRPRSFGKATVEVVTVLANHLAAAMRNGELYRALARSERELRRRATHDPLTGLANRALAGQRIEDALARTSADRQATGAVGLLFCDLDRFKAVNDRLGHDAGDELIQGVAQRLRQCVRSNDLLARFGGDEFVIMVDDAHSLTEITDLGRRIQAALVDGFDLRGERVQISASIGGVRALPGHATVGELLRDADAAMYVAKRKGRNRVEVFDAAASHRSLDHLDLRSDLPQARERGELSIAYQPIYELASRTILGFEAIPLWQHPRQGLVPPEVFIALADETEAIVPIGAWLLEQACHQMARWRRLPQGLDLTVWVGVSPVQLARPDLVREVLDTVAHARLNPADIWLEVTEHSNLTEDCDDTVARLRASGMHFALDDFGVSYSSIGNLQRLPVECLKIDRSFVVGVADHATDRGIVQAILAIAKSLRLDIIAEGIETKAQQDALLELGCGRGQGQLLQRPVTAEAATRLLAPPAPERRTRIESTADKRR